MLVRCWAWAAVAASRSDPRRVRLGLLCPIRGPVREYGSHFARDSYPLLIRGSSIRGLRFANVLALSMSLCVPPLRPAMRRVCPLFSLHQEVQASESACLQSLQRQGCIFFSCSCFFHASFRIRAGMDFPSLFASRWYKESFDAIVGVCSSMFTSYQLLLSASCRRQRGKDCHGDFS